MAIFTSFDQSTLIESISLSVIEGAYDRWFVSGQQETIAEVQGEEAGQLLGPAEQPKYVYYHVRTLTCQLDLFEEYPPVIDDKAEFQQLATKWRLERGSSSSITDLVLSPSYQAIIGMGSKAVPFILAELEAEGEHPDHWFWALQSLTRIDPVNEEDEGDLRKMARAWLHWARGRYVW